MLNVLMEKADSTTQQYLTASGAIKKIEKEPVKVVGKRKRKEDAKGNSKK
jgi:hypothetical protein